ncbi:MAG: NAD(P)-dependent oxidoreductase [Burkholderiaceae bacterium]
MAGPGEARAEAGRIGVIGIGAMGAPMARHLQRSGFAPRVRDIDPAASAAAAADGLEICASAAALAGACDVMIVVVVDAAQIEAVLFGSDGVVRAERAPGASRPTVLLCSTIAGADTERFHARLHEAGIDCIAAPISGGPARAGNGTLSMMVAAEPAVFDRCEPVLRALATSLHGVGERIGDAARFKLVNNLLAGIHLAAGAQAMALGARLGLDPGLLFDVIRASSGASWMLDDRMPRVLANDYAPRARTAILTKDVDLAMAMAQGAGVDVPMGDAALGVLQDALRAGLGDTDDAAVIGFALGTNPAP